jgi:hypothetical protein
MAFPFLRSPIGYDLAFPIRAIGSVAFVSVVPLIYWFVWLGVTNRPMPENSGHWWLVGYAAASWCLQCAIFAKRWHGQQHGEEIHTQEAGYSLLTWRSTLPAPLCEQVIVPVALAALGYAVKESVSFELGWWLILTGASYALMSNWEYRTRWAQVREPVNQMIRAQVFEERIDDHEQAARRPRAAAWGFTQDKTAQPMQGQSGEDRPDKAELGGSSRRQEPQKEASEPQEERSAYAPAEPPDRAAFARDSDSTTPDYMTWIRKRRG